MTLTVSVKRIRVRLDPSIDVFKVDVDYQNNSTWKETFGSEAEVRAFHRGLSAGYQGIIPPLEIPINYSRRE